MAWKLVICSEEDRKKYKVPFFRIGQWRNPEAGLSYLNWASNLKIDDDWVEKNDAQYGQPTRQALAAKEIFKLYQWWKEDRPKRPDPSDASGWSKYCEEKSNEAKRNDTDSWHIFISNGIKNECSDKILNHYHQLEKEQEDEDEMLIRLIKIRQNLWA